MVYNRKVHLFDERDVQRITWRLFLRIDANSSVIYQVLYRISHYMLDKILGIFGAEMFSDVVLRWLIDIGNFILGEIGARLGQSAQQIVANQLVFYFQPYSIYTIEVDQTKIT